MPPTRSLAARAAAAVLLMVGFYVLALGIAAALIAIPIAEITWGHRLDGRLAIFCVVGAFAILRAIVPRRDRFVPPGPELRETDQPRLFATIREVASATGQAMPREVYLVPEVNAWVMQRGGAMGVGSQRVMGLGLPLVEAVTVDELRAIVAHEFGHYHGGDTALGPWVYRTRAAIGRTLQNLARHSSVLMKPFQWYGAGFLRITHAISRRQEYAADALAAHTVGAAPLASGLRTLHAIGGAFVPYWMTEVAPILERGFRPPIVSGFTRFLAAPEVAADVASGLERELASGASDPYDTHPSLRDRLAALGVVGGQLEPRVPTGQGDARAITLLADVDRLEAELVSFVGTDDRTKPLTAIGWADAAPVWGGIWRDRLRVSGDRLSGITPAQIPALAADAAGTAVRFGFSPHREAAQQQGGAGQALHLLGCACVVALLDRQWALSALPGEPVVLSRDGAMLTPFTSIARLASGEMDADAWSASWRAIGLLELDLGSIGARETARGAREALGISPGAERAARRS